MHLFTDVCNGADGVARSISCEVLEDGAQQPQLNVRHRLSGSTHSILSPMGVPSPRKNVKQDQQRDRKGADMEKSAKLSMNKSSIGVIDQAGPRFRHQIPRPPRALVLVHTRDFRPSKPHNRRGNNNMVVVGDGSNSRWRCY